MGDLEALSLQPNGFLLEDELFSPTSISPLLSNPSPESISGECWKKAEETTEEIIKQIQPTVVSEQKRKGVIEYVQELLKNCLGCEAFPFGSVPLKTYLPDGDIDLTALCVQPAEDSLANDVRVVLEREEKRTDSDFEVKNVQYIHAEVKLIKCLVQNIVVDISFNQLGGLCTLCFLEKVNCLIGKNHLFKRSIILIKAWCYHESRILGAPHGLISTYALETMILYIFRLFHSSLEGPLAVLYRFLEYYSKFDWDNFCISLNGPVSISSLPELVAETPDNDGGELLLDKEYLRWCVQLFSVPSRGLEVESRSFPQKHFNIVDPLRENNNLGRSVSKGNFYRIRSAFTFGARKLGQILLLTAEDITDELNKFFMNTLDRHGRGKRPDMQVSVLNSNPTGNRTMLNSPCVNFRSTSGDSRSCPEGLLQEEISNIHISGSQRKSSTRVRKEPQRCTTRVSSSLDVLERFGYIKEFDISKGGLVGDTEDYFSPQMSSLLSQGTNGDIDTVDAPVSTSGSVGIPNFLSDFSDDFDSHYNNLRFAKCHYGSFSGHFLSSPPLSCPLQRNHDFDNPDLPLQLNGNEFTQLNVNGVCPRPHFFPMHPHIVSGSAFGVEDPSQRNKHGIGTFFPDLVLSELLYKERSSFSGRSSPRIPNCQLNRRFRESNCFDERDSDVPPQEQYPSPRMRAKPIMSAGYFSMPRGLSLPCEKVEFGSFGHLPCDATSAVGGSKQPGHSQGNSSELAKVTTPTPRPVSGVHVEGSKREAYHLEKETDFPPLSVPVSQSSK